MKVQMKRLEAWCNEYRSRWNKKHMWDLYTLVGGAWLDGFHKAREEGVKPPNLDRLPIPEIIEGYSNYIKTLGDEPVEVEIESPQIGQDVKFTKEQFKRDMSKFYNCEDLHVQITDKGLVSFQGTFKTKI